MKEKIILSDLDKTIVDVHSHFIQKMGQCLDFLKIKYKKKELNETNHLYAYLESIGVDVYDNRFWAKMDEFDNREEGIKKGKIRLFPDAKEFLEYVKNFKSAIVSDTPLIKAQPEIDAFRLKDYFNVFSHWDPSKTGKAKPNPLLAMEALEKLGYNGTEYVYVVGDDQVDINCGLNLESELGKLVTKIHVNRNGNICENADYVVEDLAGAVYVIGR
jgi:HAD superfamily hydrolase (TIGR01549 family)